MDYPWLMRGFLVLLPSLLAIAAPLPARADEPAPEAELRREALQRMQTGRFEDAREAHRLLWRTAHRPADAFNIGMLSYGMHDWTTAAEFLTRFLALEPPPDAATPADKRARYERARLDLEQARTHVGALVVRVSEPGASVLLDGAPAGTSPLEHPVFVLPGEHRLEARLGDKRSRPVRITAAAGSEHTVRISIDQGPATSSMPMPASREPGFQPGFQRTAAIVAGGAMIVGTGLTIAAVSLFHDAGDQARRLRQDGGPGACRSEAYKDACSGLQDTVVLSDALAGGAVVSFAVGGVLTAVALASPWLSPARSGSAGVRVRSAGGGAGLAFEAVW